jgi:ABC-type nitrate/sulfonate/bicarbonate transport system substrate-binding protein
MRPFLAALVAVLLLTISGAGAQNLTKLTVGATATDDTTPLLYAQSAGLFRRAGLEIEIQKVTSGAAGMAALAGGSLSLTGTNLLSVVQAHLKGVPFVMIVPGGLYNGTSEFVAAVAKPSNPIRTGKDLNNKIVGVASVGDLNAIALMAWVDSNGGDSKTIKQVEVPYGAIPAALEENRIEVGTLLQPILSAAVDSGRSRIFAKTYDAIAPRFLITSWITTSNFANANADVMRRFARIVREAEIYCNGHRTETAPLLAAFSGIDVQQVLKGGRDTYAATFLDVKDVQPLIDSAFKYGVIEKRFDAAEMFSPVVRGLTP